MSKDKSRLDFIQDTKLCVIGGDYFTVIDADTDGSEYRYKKAESVREAIDNAMAEIGVSQGADSHGWIKCSDELPECAERVLVLDDDMSCYFASLKFDGSRKYWELESYDQNIGYGVNVEFDEILYWRPELDLPQD